MSKDKPSAPNIDGSDLYIGIVASRFNADLVDKLVERVRETLRKHKVAAGSIKLLRVPGANELPYVANMLAQTDEYDCVIALGVVLAGETNHHEHIAHATGVALQGIAIQSEVPVINGIIVAPTREQAEARIFGDMDRGAEFAHAAVEMAWHRVQLCDYLDTLDEEAAKAEREAFEAGELDDEEDDDKGFGGSGDGKGGRNPFHKN